jgi:hypothetical protein
MRANRDSDYFENEHCCRLALGKRRRDHICSLQARSCTRVGGSLRMLTIAPAHECS